MRTLGTIKLKKRTQPEWLIWLIVVMPFLFGTFFELLRLPSLFKYLLDAANLLLILYLVLKIRFTSVLDKKLKGPLAWIIVLVALTFFAYVAQYQSILYYLWGLRNNYRYYVLFFAVALFLDQNDIDHYFSLLDKVFWVNAVVSLAQYFLLGINGDHLGGLFGAERGCNTYTNMFFVVITAKTVVNYLNKQEELASGLTKIAVMLVVAALAELKFFYIEFLLIVVMAVLMTNFSWRKVLVLIGGLGGTMVGAYILTLLFPNSTGFLSIEGILNIAASKRGYTSSGDLNRLTAIPIISERFLKTFPQKLFGLGLGNCDTSNYHFLSTPFYGKYSYLNYLRFSIASIFLETGYLGLGMFFGFFVLVIWKIARMKKYTVMDTCYGQIAILVAVCCMMITFYNSTLRMEAGYMLYFILALPFVKAGNMQSEELSE